MIWSPQVKPEKRRGTKGIPRPSSTYRAARRNALRKLKKALHAS